MAYKYRIGEVKDLRAVVRPTSDDQALTITTAKIRLFGQRDTQIFEKDAVVEGNILKYRMSEIKIKGTYKIPWVYTIAGQTLLSNKFTLTVEA